MSVTLTLVGKTPGQTQFGLDTFTERYKCDASADVVLTDGSVPAMGSAHPDYDFMFVTARYCSETGESASALDLTYTGCLAGEMDPTLPPTQGSTGNPIQSATSSFATTGVPLLTPISVEFYAAQNRLSYVSYSAEGVTEADTPTADPKVKTVTFSGAGFAGIGADSLAAIACSIAVVATIDSNEIVAGQFWLNTALTIKYFIPATMNVNADGVYLGLTANGAGYTVGDTLTFTGGSGAATATVTAILPNGGVAGWNVTSNTFTTSEGTMSASGGTGSGCEAEGVVI